MEVSTMVNHSAFAIAPNSKFLHILKEPDLFDQDLRCSNENSQERSQKSELHNTVIVESGSAFNSTNVEDPSVSVLNGEDCGLAAQVSVDNVDALERSEVQAAHTGEFEAVENDHLSTEKRQEESRSGENGQEREEETQSGENSDTRQEITQPDESSYVRGEKRGESGEDSISNDRSECQGSTENFDFQDRATLSSDLGLDYNYPREGQEQIDWPPFVHAQLNGKIEQTHLLESSNVSSRDAEGTGSDRGKVDPSDNAKGEDHHGCPQDSERIVLENFRVAPCPSQDDNFGVLQNEEVISEEAKTSTSGADHQKTEDAGVDGSSNILVLEVIGDVCPRDAEGTCNDKLNVDPLENDKHDDVDSILQSDKASNYSEDEDHMSSTFSGPIAFSGVLSYSGMISQIPHSGNLSLHSDSSTSTRSFAFPVLASEWNSSPAKIGPPDSRYFRRRRRWRPRFCCKRPTTLFD